MNFEEAHAAWIARHLERRTGERRARLERGHRTAEKQFCRSVWWPLRGHFGDLHPEYEVLDWRGRPYFCDFVWLPASVKLAIEIKGFGPHVRDMDRQSYAHELNRETFLTAAGFQIISFSYDDVAGRPELCVTLLRLVIGRYEADRTPTDVLQVVEREIVRLACGLAHPIRPIDVERHLNVNHRVAVRALRDLCAKGKMAPVRGPEGRYVVKYKLLPPKGGMPMEW